MFKKSTDSNLHPPHFLTQPSSPSSEPCQNSMNLCPRRQCKIGICGSEKPWNPFSYSFQDLTRQRHIWLHEAGDILLQAEDREMRLFPTSISQISWALWTQIAGVGCLKSTIGTVFELEVRWLGAFELPSLWGAPEYRFISNEIFQVRHQ